MKLGIVTPTYNRKHLLQRLYESLLKQTNYNFTWIIIDDGSEDGTKLYIDNLKAPFKIRYSYTQNGGKVKALNQSFENNQDIDLFLIVDSDDYLLDDAIELVLKYGEKYEKNQSVGALFFRYQFESGKILGENELLPNDEAALSRIEHDSKFSKIDGTIAYFKRVTNKYRYPEFKDEKYMGPTVIQLMMSEEYKIIFTNIVVGVAEYQVGGLTDSGRKIRIKSPKSMLVYCHYMQDDDFTITTRIKYGIMANSYYYILRKFNTMNKLDEQLINKIKIPKILYPFGWILAKYWLNKYH